MKVPFVDLAAQHTAIGDELREALSAVITRGDHRIAMSFAIASLRAEAPLEILDVANVATSFPGFARLANSVGLRIEERA